MRLIALPAGRGRRALARLPFLLLAFCGLVMMGQGAIIPAKAWLAQILLERAFEQGLASHRPVKAWPWADAAPIARIRVPRLGVDELVLSGGSGEAMAFGPSLLPRGRPPGALVTRRFRAPPARHRYRGRAPPGARLAAAAVRASMPAPPWPG